MEKENMKIVDDPNVWEFSLTEGVCKGPSVPVNKVPESLVLPYEVTKDRMKE